MEHTRRITDLALAAFLLVAGHCLRAVNREHGRGAFVFEDTPSLAQDLLGFYNRTARVDPLTFAETLRSLKAAAQAA